MEAEADNPLVAQVIEQLKTLPQELQWRVLEFTRALAISTPRGVPLMFGRAEKWRRLHPIVMLQLRYIRLCLRVREVTNRLHACLPDEIRLLHESAAGPLRWWHLLRCNPGDRARKQNNFLAPVLLQLRTA